MENWRYSRFDAQFPCVYVDQYGLWAKAPCNQSLPSVCKHSTGTQQNNLIQNLTTFANVTAVVL